MLHQVWYWLQGSANASYLKKASGGFGKHGLRIQATFSCLCRRKRQLTKYFWRHSLLGIQKMSPNCLRSPRSWMSPPLKCKCGWFTRQGANIFFSSVSRAPKGRTSKGWIWEGEDFSGRKTLSNRQIRIRSLKLKSTRTSCITFVPRPKNLDF